MEQKDSGILQKDVNVVVSKAPVLSPIFESVEIGLSLREIFNRYTGLSEQHTKIFVNGEEPVDWNYCVVEKDCVSVCQVPSGPAVLVPLIISTVVGLVVGYIMYSMIDQPETGTGRQLERITGARNEAKPYEPIPFILGKRRVVPSYAAQPYTYWQGDQQWLKMLLCVGYGPLEITDIKIGDNPITNYDDLNYSVLDWYNVTDTSSIRRIWNTDVQQDAVNQELGRFEYLNRAAPSNTSKVRLDYIYPQGLWRTDDGDIAHAPSGIQVRFYANGEWYSIAKVHTLSSAGVVENSLIKDAGRYYISKVEQGSVAGITFSTINKKATDVTDLVVREENGLAYIKNFALGHHYVNTTTHWEGTRDQLNFSFSWRPIDPVTGDPLTGNVPLNIKRLSYDYDPNGAAFATTAQLTTITYELGDSVDDSYFGIDHDQNRFPVLIALDVRATEQLSGVIDNLSCQAQTRVPNTSLFDDWKDYSIFSSWFPTSNPAHIYKWVLQGFPNGSAVSNTRLNNQAIVDWAGTCTTRGWECNEIVNYNITLKDLLSNVAFTGRAFFSMNEGRFSVIENKEKTNPVQVFTIKNSRGLKSRREFPLSVDGIRYTFANADFEDQEDEGFYGDPDKFFNFDVTRPKTGATITGRYDDLEMWGTTSPSLARDHARFAFFEKRLRREVYTLETDIESLVARRGDKVLLAHDIIDVGLGQGFIKQITATQFRVDETINLVAGQTYAMTVRSVNSGVSITTITAEYDGDGWWNYSLPTSIAVGDLVAYGAAGTQTLECLVTEVSYTDDYEASLTLKNYAEALYDEDAVYLPEYESGLNPERPRDITPLAPAISVNTGNFTYESNSITARVNQVPADPSEIGSFRLQYKYTIDGDNPEVEAQQTWFDGGVSPASSGRFNIPVSNNQGNIILIRAKCVNTSGVHGPWSDVEEVLLQNDPAPDVQDFTITEEVNKPKTPDASLSTLTIEITPPAQTGAYLYAIAEYRQPEQDDYQVIGTLGWRDPNQISVEVFADGRQYEIRVRSVSIYGLRNKNGISKLFTTTNTADPEYTEDNPFLTLPAPNVTGLELFDQGNDTEFGGRDAKFVWRKATIVDWVEIGFEGLKGASSSELDQYFRDYEVEVVADNDVVRTENVVDNMYTYTYEKNAEDYERRYGVPGAYRDFRISVIMRTRQNQESEKPAVIDVSNTAPKALQNLVVNPGWNVIEISYQKPTDLDFAGVDIWIETTQGFDPDATTPFATISDNSFVASGLTQETTYYIRLRPFDDFGKTGTNTTSEFVITTKTGQDLTGLSGWAYEIDPVSRTFIQNNAENGAIDLGDPIVGGQLATAKLADLAVEAAKLADSSVTATKIANLAVGTAAIDTAAITNAKIANLAVGNTKIQDAAITTAKIGDAQITNAKIIDLTATKLTAGTINAVGGITTESIFRAVDDINSPQHQTGIGPLSIDGTTFLMWGYDAGAAVGDKLRFGIDELGNAYFQGELEASSFTNTNLTIDTAGNLTSTGTFRFGGASSEFVEFDGTNLEIDTPEFVLSGGSVTVGVGDDNLSYDSTNGLLVNGGIRSGSVDGSNNFTGTFMESGSIGFADSSDYITLSGGDYGWEIFSSGAFLLNNFSSAVPSNSQLEWGIGDFVGTNVPRLMIRNAGVAILNNSSGEILHSADDLGATNIRITTSASLNDATIYTEDNLNFTGSSSTVVFQNSPGVEIDNDFRVRGNVRGDSGILAIADTAKVSNINAVPPDYSNEIFHGFTGNSQVGVNGFGRNLLIGGGYASNEGVGVRGDGGQYDFYAVGPGANYAPFTGSHDAVTDQNDMEVGDITIISSMEYKSGVSSTLPRIELSVVPMDKRVFGAHVSTRAITETHFPALMQGDKSAVLKMIKDELFWSSINAIGEGQVNVCNEGGDIQIGDFICTSSTPGKGMRYDGMDMRYVVARCMEPVNWEEEDSNIKMVACIYLCG